MADGGGLRAVCLSITYRSRPSPWVLIDDPWYYARLVGVGATLGSGSSGRISPGCSLQQMSLRETAAELVIRVGVAEIEKINQAGNAHSMRMRNDTVPFVIETGPVEIDIGAGLAQHEAGDQRLVIVGSVLENRRMDIFVDDLDMLTVAPYRNVPLADADGLRAV